MPSFGKQKQRPFTGFTYLSNFFKKKKKRRPFFFFFKEIAAFYIPDLALSLTYLGEGGKWDLWVREVEARGWVIATRTSLVIKVIPPKPTPEP